MKRSVLFSILLVLLAVSCNSDKGIRPRIVDISLNFSHLVDGNTVQLDQLIYKNALGQEFSIMTIKYFVSRLKLYLDDNTIIELPGIYYIDIRSPETLKQTISEKIPEGNYNGMSFVYGLTPADNISGRFTQPPQSLMEWPELLGGGYHYAKIEGKYKTPAGERFFNLHSGMLNGTAYEIHVDLKSQPFVVSGTSVDLLLKMEMQNWFAKPTDWDFTYFGPAVMGNPEAQKTIRENGANVFSFEVITNQ
jgi:MbnP